jgi:hypothetical protein
VHGRVLPLLLAAALLGACAGAPTTTNPTPTAVQAPLLQLSPASAGREIALAQRLEIEARGQRQSVEALLEVDAASVRLALLQLGRPLARLEWDGRVLRQERAPGVPEALSAERILSEMQFVQWPAGAIRAALPEGWSLREGEGGTWRELCQGGEAVLRVDRPAPGVAVLRHLRDGYRLRIESTPIGGS